MKKTLSIVLSFIMVFSIVGTLQMPVFASTSDALALTTTTVESTGTDYKFTITPKKQLTTETLLLALYDGDKFVAVKKVEYTSEGISPVIVPKNINITKAKVFLWYTLENLSPVSSAEKIDIPATIMEQLNNAGLTVDQIKQIDESLDAMQKNNWNW